MAAKRNFVLGSFLQKFRPSHGNNDSMEHKGNYLLMRKDAPVCEFFLYANSRHPHTFSAELVEVFDKERMPIETRAGNGYSIGDFFENRLYPLYAGHLGDNVIVNGQPLASSFGNIIKYTAGTSLIDDFWMMDVSDKAKSWDYVNLFDNKINSQVSDLAFSGNGIFETDSFIHSPDFTTDGYMDKAWRDIDGKLLLYKSGGGWRSQGGVYFSEFYASQIAQRLGVSHVSYGLDMWFGRLCSTCELFTSEKTSYINADKYLGNTPISSFVKSLDRKGYLYSELADIILFDAIVGNGRHAGNFGFLQDNDTLEITGFAPIFDNGSALFTHAADSQLKDPRLLSTFARLGSMRNGTASLSEVKELLTDRQRNLAKSMEGFKFKRHDEHNLSEGRLKDLEMIVQRRALELSKAPD
ncbi:MAG: hypothetical protein FWG10_00935 [Eubacteriaceae bacterium]|nr:hypothetical protein [Eubacteriaceae bacterium]